MPARKIPSDYHALAKQRGFEWLGPEVEGSKSKTTWLCGQGHRWTTSYFSVQRGNGCHVCSGARTAEGFIEKAKQIHGDRYDYSRVNFSGSKVEVEIICSVHGSFWQTPSNHYKVKVGCQQCAKEELSKSKTLDTQEFIRRANLVHNGKYDYSLVQYKKGDIKVRVTCPDHGVFEQTPSNHVNNGQGCPKCKYEVHAKLLSSNTQEFIEKAIAVHGGRYDYSLVEYIGNKKPVKITCRQHGIFEMTPNAHLSQKQNCPKCGAITGARALRLNTEKFIEKAQQVHGDKYDYSLVEYRWNNIEVKIVCPKHGLFEQKPVNHIAGRGCPECGKQTVIDFHTLDISNFLERAKQTHGNKYDYSKARYVNTKRPVKIICSRHGAFWQIPKVHVKGAGCPECASSRGEGRIAALLKWWGINYTRQKKFDKCKNQTYLPFDFYFQLGDKYFLIEYDGEQHFEPLEFFGGKKGFKERQRSDAIKNQFAKDHGFILIRIPYWHLNNVEHVLRSEIEKYIGSIKPRAEFKPTEAKPIDPLEWIQACFM